MAGGGGVVREKENHSRKRLPSTPKSLEESLKRVSNSISANRGLPLGSRPPLTGVSRALRARNPQRVSERVSRGLPALGSKKCPKQSQKSLHRLKIDCFETPETLLRLFRTLFEPQGRKALGDSFGDSLGISGPKGRGDSCKGRAGSQVYPHPWAGVCETKSKKGVPETENPSCIGFAVLGRGLPRPWSRKGPDHGVGADPSLQSIGRLSSDSSRDFSEIFLSPGLNARHRAILSGDFTAPPQNRVMLKASRCSIYFRSKIVSER